MEMYQKEDIFPRNRVQEFDKAISFDGITTTGVSNPNWEIHLVNVDSRDTNKKSIDV